VSLTDPQQVRNKLATSLSTGKLRNSGGDHVGVLGPDPLTFWQWGSKCARTPTFKFLVSYCYTWPVIHSMRLSSADSGWTLHARWFLYVHWTSMWIL